MIKVIRAKQSPVEKVVLELTPDETILIASLTGAHVVGHGELRKVNDSIYKKLESILVTNNLNKIGSDLLHLGDQYTLDNLNSVYTFKD